MSSGGFACSFRIIRIVTRIVRKGTCVIVIKIVRIDSRIVRTVIRKVWIITRMVTGLFKKVTRMAKTSH